MEELIISGYDSGFRISYMLLHDDKIISEGENAASKGINFLYNLHLIDSWDDLDTSNINSSNILLQQFDRITVCIDGEIWVYLKGKDY